MHGRSLLAALVVLIGCSVAGCAAGPPPDTASPTEFESLLEDRLDAVWARTGADDAIRPSVPLGRAVGQFDGARAFSLCMQERGWPEYFSHETGYSYRAIQLAPTEAERLDWYECFAQSPVDSVFSLRSIEQYDYLYDYFQDSLIPCLEQHGYSIDYVPSRFEFRTTWFDWSDPLFPVVWNPYFDVADYQGPGSLSVMASCPSEPPGQHFYALD